MKTTIKTRYEMYIQGDLYMLFDEEKALFRFVNRMHKIGLFKDIEIYKVRTITEREKFTNYNK